MIRSLLVLSGFFVASVCSAQVHGNEWIDHSRQYWMFQIAVDGLARIDSATLAQSGFPVTSVDPRHIMLFNREQQVPIYVEGESDGVFNTGDFIEFRAQKNDAWLDERLFSNPNNLANPYYSFFNDTIRYYLTWDPDAPKERITAHADQNFDPYIPRDWFWGEAVRSLVGRYFPGRSEQYGMTSGFYIEGEGYFHTALMNASDGNTSEQVVAVTTPRVYAGAGAPDAQVKAVAVGVNAPGSGNPDHHLQVAYGANAPGTLVFDTTYAGNKVIRSEFDVPASAIGSSLSVRFKAVADLGYSPDQQTPSNVVVRYARDFAMNSVVMLPMEIPNDPNGDPAHIVMTGVSGIPVIHAYGDSVRRILPQQVSGGTWRALIPADLSSSTTKAIFFRENQVIPIASLAPVNGNGWFTDLAAVNADSALLIVTHASLMNGAIAYANVRESSERNPMNTFVIDVDELYDQFGGGIPKHGLSIRRYCKFLADSWTTQPAALFLIGKSVQAHRLNNFSPSYRPDLSGAYANCLVPSFGHPASDPCITIGINFTPYVMEMPVGRLSATSDQQIQAYIEKVQAFEAQEPAAWMKNILHFMGGFTASETQGFANLMAPMKEIAQDTSFGGRVYDFKKTASGVFQNASADSVRMFIEDEGVTLMNFMAHAFANGFDITIDDPSNYNWNGKHPVVIGNSCYIGNVHLNTTTSEPEEWVMMPQQGPIAFLASIDIGLANYLAVYTRGWYESFSQVNYGRGIGEHMKYAGQNVMQGGNLMNLNTAHTFTLQGDPTLVLNSFPLPDYSVKAENIFFDPAEVSAAVDSFEVKVVVENIGKAVHGSFVVQLERNAPLLGGTQLFAQTVTDLFSRDTIVFTLATQAFAGGHGLNTFTVKVDLEPDEIPELDDSINNQVNAQLFIRSGDLVPVYPYDFAIVPEPVQELKASTGDPLAPLNTYHFQIDTTDLFNSPILETTMVQAPGGVVSWQPQNIFSINGSQDSTVFFWRCGLPDSTSGEMNWYERSFQYIEGKHGWGQAHYFQFKDNDYAGVVYDRPNREFDFFTGQRNLIADVAGNATGEAGYATKWSIGLQPVDYGTGCAQIPAWMVAVVDPLTFEPWWTYHPAQNPDGIDFGNANNSTACRNRQEGFFVFPMNDPASQAGMVNMLNTIPDGHHILIYTYRYLQKDSIQQYAPGLIAALEGIGMPDFDALADSVPFAMYVRKGDPSTYEDEIGSALSSNISLSVWVDASTDQGFITTGAAGPALQWHKLYWRDVEQGSDSMVIILQGLPAGGGAAVDLFELQGTEDSLDLATVSAIQYPRLKLRGHFFDLNNPTPDPSQIDRWQLLSTPAPECAIHPPLGYGTGLEGLAQGQDAWLAVAVQNISEFNMDSLLMTAWVVDANNIRTRIHYEVKQPLPAGAHVIDTIHFSTWGLGGMTTLIVEANPIDTITGEYHQLEQYHFNNLLHVRFDIDQDLINPLLDVTFDGRHILDGDIVSARPEIVITLDDENTVLLMDSPSDTANFRVYLTPPNGGIERLYFRDGNGNENMQFIPADGPENVAKIQWRPVFTVDGEYQLAVEATDQSANHSGDQRYSINFEVITRPTITEILNYPNPFTTNTRFVFTLTGHQVPTQMKIQILTVTGRVVREIGMHELGIIRVGRNITDFAWDGTDQFGDRLARGVYLYRVLAKLNGEDIEYRETSAGQYFNKGFGKMYLLK